MKTLTTLTAVAALIAGISIASAASTTSQNTLGGSESANAQFCSKGHNGALNCTFASMTACEQVAKPEGATCIPNPKSTTGSASSSSTSSDMNKTNNKMK